MTPGELRDLFADDRWATERILAVLDGIDDAQKAARSPSSGDETA